MKFYTQLFHNVTNIKLNFANFHNYITVYGQYAKGTYSEKSANTEEVY